MPHLVSRRSSQPHPVSVTQDRTPCNPLRPKLHRFERFQRMSMPMMVNDLGAETDSARAKDRESLKLLLQATSHTERSTRSAGSDGATSSELTDSSLVQRTPSADSSIRAHDPFLSNLSLSLPSDSGSDLVSTLHRLRVKCLASYFDEMERIARLGPSPSSTALIRKGVEGDTFDDAARDDDNAGKVELETWEEITMSDVNQGGLTI